MFVFYIPGEGTVCLIYTRKGYFLYILNFFRTSNGYRLFHAQCVSLLYLERVLFVSYIMRRLHSV